jgi:predicted TIM-barrel enzyme
VERVLAAKGATALPVLIGSGLRPENAGKLLMAADGAIVGTYLRKDGDPMKPIDPERTRRLMEAVKELKKGSSLKGVRAREALLCSNLLRGGHR